MCFFFKLNSLVVQTRAQTKKLANQNAAANLQPFVNLGPRGVCVPYIPGKRSQRTITIHGTNDVEMVSSIPRKRNARVVTFREPNDVEMVPNNPRKRNTRAVTVHEREPKKPIPRLVRAVSVDTR